MNKDYDNYIKSAIKELPETQPDFLLLKKKLSKNISCLFQPMRICATDIMNFWKRKTCLLEIYSPSLPPTGLPTHQA